MKKIISILLAVVVMMTMACTAFAVESNTSVKMEADKTDVSVGDIITVSIATPKNSELCVLSYDITYDTGSFEYIENSMKLNNTFPLEDYNNAPGIIRYAGISARGLSGDSKVVFTLQLKVLNSGEISSRIVEAYTCDENNEEINVTEAYKSNSTPCISVTVDEIIPTEPEIPEEPVEPEIPEEPVEPETPTDPVEPEIPEEPVEPEIPEEPVKPENNACISIVEPSKKTIKYKNEAVLNAEVSGKTSDGTYIEWTANNKNFKTTKMGDSLKITSDKTGYTTFTANLIDVDGNILASDTIEMYSKAGFFDKIVWFFTNLF